MPATPSLFPASVGWTALATAAALALLAANFRLDQGRLATRATLAEQETRLADAELRAARNQLEAERLLAAAQNQQWKNARAETERLRAELDAARNTIPAHATGVRLASLSAPARPPTDARGAVLWNPHTQQGVLTVSKLPAPPADRDYQLWLSDPQYPHPVNGGVFTVEPTTGEARVDFTTGQPVREAARFTISLERKGGAPVAEGPTVLTGS